MLMINTPTKVEQFVKANMPPTCREEVSSITILVDFLQFYTFSIVCLLTFTLCGTTHFPDVMYLFFIIPGTGKVYRCSTTDVLRDRLRCCKIP